MPQTLPSPLNACYNTTAMKNKNAHNPHYQQKLTPITQKISAQKPTTTNEIKTYQNEIFKKYRTH